jgi:hypothetical protein
MTKPIKIELEVFLPEEDSNPKDFTADVETALGKAVHFLISGSNTGTAWHNEVKVRYDIPDQAGLINPKSPILAKLESIEERLNNLKF